ncbi:MULTISPECIES: cobalamin-dependent protein [Actinosynnema]|uniref:cobalamin B12-binding domain-containing protein n=1 Tax=Actinosynnema TaxID=40566 RepID=UPI0020A5782A|nr:cobalamin-dependent protein [Actinosynnema pretiosum]MCP2092764.1 Methanogenic corrinoid protein MtbC1 [Actinosynnema pretiosum]
MSGARDRLLAALEAADEPAATAVVLRLLDSGAPLEELLLDVVADVQVEIGLRWQRNLWTTAQEHAATSIVERIIGVAGAREARPVTRGHVVLACLDGEWHAVPPRIVAEVLRLRGWRVEFLGASVPVGHLVAHLHEHGPDAVALSCTLSSSLPRADQVATACLGTGTPVLVGGLGFGVDGRWARALGLDAWAPTATAAAELLEQPRWSRTAPAAARRDVDPEHAALRARRAELVGAALSAAVPGSPLPPEVLLEDAGHLVDHLAASLYVDDPGLFGSFVDWNADAQAARGVPPSAAVDAMTAMSRVLRDHPRALRHLDHGLDVLRTSS